MSTSAAMPSGFVGTLIRRWAGPLLRGRRAGDATLVCNDSTLSQLPRTVQLRSHAFVDGGPMPARSAGPGVGDNRSPALSWTGMPHEATHWVLLIEDPDVPLPCPIVHALTWGSVSVRQLDEGAIQGYAGPRPMPGHGPHRYVFQLFAVDAAPTQGLARETLLPWLRTHALACGRLQGSFQRDWLARVVQPE